MPQPHRARCAALLALLAASPCALFACEADDDDTRSSGNSSESGDDHDKAPAGDTKASSKAGPTKVGPAERSGYTEGDVANAGRITGTVTYRGARQSGSLVVNKDEQVCNHGGQSDGTIVVTDGHLQNALVYLVGVERGRRWGSEPAAIDNHECMFAPHVVIARHRSEIAITNSDPVLHNTNLTLREGGRTLGNVSLPRQGQTANKELRKEGLVEVRCDVHPWMHAYVFVSQSPYAVVSAADGTFTMEGVPPGTYTAKVWHEVLGEKEMSVTVAANGTATLDVAFE